MSYAGKAFATDSSQAAPLELGELVQRLGDLPARRPDGQAYSSETVSSSLVMQADELQRSLLHDARAAVLGAQLACMLCDVVRLANLRDVDVVAATERHLSAETAQLSARRPSLRPVH